MRRRSLPLILTALLLLFFSLSPSLHAQSVKADMEKLFSAQTDSVRRILGLDKRTSIFEIRLEINGSDGSIEGKTSVDEAVKLLMDRLQGHGFRLRDNVRRLPDASELDGKVYGLVRVSVANMRSEGDFSSEMVTQAIMGTPVRILEKDSWLRIQTPEGYIGWVHSSSIIPFDAKGMNEWMGGKQIVFTDRMGYLYSRPLEGSATLSDLVAGCRMRLLESGRRFLKVALPDGRQGYVKTGQASELESWRKGIKSHPSAVIATARTLLGFPYLWAGMSTKGMDCSGFVRTVLSMHDIIIPRDASQMCLKGERFLIEEDLSNLLKGDLLFFGRKGEHGAPDRVSHVGIYTEKGCFIHCLGYVQEVSLVPGDPLYDAYNHSRLLSACRILEYVNVEDGLETTDRNPMYQAHYEDPKY